MAENKYKQPEGRQKLTPVAAIKTASKDHRSRKNMGSAEFFKKQRHERNESRSKQVTMTLSNPDGTIDKVVGPFRVEEN